MNAQQQDALDRAVANYRRVLDLVGTPKCPRAAEVVTEASIAFRRLRQLAPRGFDWAAFWREMGVTTVSSPKKGTP